MCSPDGAYSERWRKREGSAERNFPIHREWDALTLSKMFPSESRGKKLMHLVQTELTNLRDQIAHSIMRSGELSLSADDLVQVQRVNKWLPLTRSIASRMLENDFPTQFLSYLGDDGTYRHGR